MGDETGNASVLVVALTGAMVAVLAATLMVGAAHLAKQRAASAADLAALAAADAAAGRVGGDPCAIADRVAAANSTALEDCVMAGLEATVAVGADVPGGWRVTVRARAGPPGRPDPAGSAATDSRTQSNTDSR